MPELHSTTVFV